MLLRFSPLKEANFMTALAVRQKRFILRMENAFLQKKKGKHDHIQSESIKRTYFSINQKSALK